MDITQLSSLFTAAAVAVFGAVKAIMALIAYIKSRRA